ncbi:MAG: MBL fold metallo-hydrolase [Planctomycetota bacterium]
MSTTRPNVDPREVIAGFELGPYPTNCFVVTAPGTDACWLVDASWQPEPMIEHVRSRGLEPEMIILTHAHLDHIAGLDVLRAAFPGVRTWLHPEESSWLGDPRLNLSINHAEHVVVRDAEETINPGDTLTLGDLSWDVHHTPGHSPGSVSLHCAHAGVAIVGDTLFAGSIGRSDFPTSDEAALHASIRDVLYALSDDTIVCPGHGPTTTIGREKSSNPFVRA